MMRFFVSTLVSRVKSFAADFIKRSWMLETSDFVPSDQKRFLKEDAWKFKWIFKYLKRRIFIGWLGQSNSLLSHIPSNVRRILWINLSAPSLGDSLMDLAGRVLLRDYQVDLLTDKKNASLYQGDDYFNHVFHDVGDAEAVHSSSPYDLVILDAFSPKILRLKSKYFCGVPFVGVWGFVNGFEVHRTLYSFYRLEALLKKDCIKDVKLVPTLSPPPFFDAGLSKKKQKVVIVVGAEWAYRRYAHWVEVVSLIKQEYQDTFQFVLVGSSNGESEAGSVMAKFPDCKSFVGRCSLSQTASIIDQSDFVLAADGGLWHVACSLGKPSVVLFANTHIFDDNGERVTRETQDLRCEVLYANTVVSEIHPDEVLSQFEKLKNAVNCNNE